MRLLIFVVGFLVSITGCQEPTPHTSVIEQTEAVEKAREELGKERKRLVAMIDSLDIKVAENVELGMSEEKARSLETAMINVQKSVVEASEANLKTQEGLLETVKGLSKQ